MTDHAHAHPHTAAQEHDHPRGLRGFLHEIFVPHTHDVADSIDDAARANRAGIRAVKVSLVLMLATTLAQAAIVVVSGSIALLADTVHNLSDALTAVPLWIAFVLTRRRPTRTYPNGLGRAEDLAGLAIVATIALSAVVAAWQAIDRLIDPQPISHLGWVMAAGIVGFAGNEAVAIYRIRVGRRIGSAALVADGVHARTDGFTSLAVVLGGLGVMLGFPLADPIVGLLIAALIVALLVGTLRSVGRRLLDGVDPQLTLRAEEALSHVPEIERVDRLRLRWSGHRLQGDAVVACAGRTAADVDRVRTAVQREAREHLPHLDTFIVEVAPSASPRDPTA
ncbi:cation diffusion facilitator family transporter [Microbacterium karelineae]|uniref:cation diffusion facilitator family transporter n=1 Tax=Microbacterium karelineae TaxID=2654283 RepID=UPI0012E9AC18|nr:cation diffusion facilitator family transporter [Microbacterium karelineae]